MGWFYGNYFEAYLRCDQCSATTTAKYCGIRDGRIDAGASMSRIDAPCYCPWCMRKSDADKFINRWTWTSSWKEKPPEVDDVASKWTKGEMKKLQEDVA